MYSIHMNKIILTLVLLVACGGRGPAPDDEFAPPTSPDSPSIEDPDSSEPTDPGEEVYELQGHYRYNKTTCGVFISYPGNPPEFMRISEDSLTMTKAIPSCGTDQRDTITYSLEYTNTSITTQALYTLGYSSPGTCASPSTTYHPGAAVNTYNVILTETTLVIESANDCDGFGNHTRTHYIRQN